MASHVALALQTKLFTLLNGDAALKNKVTGVFDNVPDTQKYPFVVIGDTVLEDFGTKNSDGFQGDVTVHVYSQAAGRREALAIQGRVYELLHNVDLGLEGFSTITCRCTLNEVLKDPDNRTHHGVQKYRLILGGS